MSAPMSAPAKSVTQSNLALLKMIGGVLELSHSRLRAPLTMIRTDTLLGTLPAAVVLALERHDPLRISLAARADVGGPVAALNVLAARWRVPRVLRNPQKPASPYGKRPVFDEIRAAELLEQIRNFPIAPAAVIVGGSGRGESGYEIWALYPTAPTNLRGAANRVYALGSLNKLAKRIGSDPWPEDTEIGNITLPLPGGAIDEGQETACAQFLSLDLSRRYTLASIEKEIT